jgi:hypothetical protein
VAPDGKHVISANEGTALATAAGHHMATGEVPMVYLQNSGLGNIVNPLMSLVSLRQPTADVVCTAITQSAVSQPSHIEPTKDKFVREQFSSNEFRIRTKLFSNSNVRINILLNQSGKWVDQLMCRSSPGSTQSPC